MFPAPLPAACLQQSPALWTGRNGLLEYRISPITYRGGHWNWAKGSDRWNGIRSKASINSNNESINYYEVLGVTADARIEDIQKAYRQLQKKHHPDIVGEKGHAMTLLLNEAYETLSNESTRASYNFAHSYAPIANHSSYTGAMYSTWNGGERSQGLFVDENACVGCRECKYVAKNTFTFDENAGSARVKCQWGDSEDLVRIAIQSCPVNCIHWVEKDDLPVLEYLIQPQPRTSNGVYGGGWQRPSNVFMAARSLKRKMETQNNKPFSNGADEKETPAQRRARMEADLKLQSKPLWWLWSVIDQFSKDFGPQFTWNGDPLRRTFFGQSCSSELFSCLIAAEDARKVVESVQEWATTFASSSELPLPMPFKANLLANGVHLILISAANGVLSSIGGITATMEEIKATEDQESSQDIWRFSIRRDGGIDSRPLPGEGRIVHLIKDILFNKNCAYKAYHLQH